MAGAQLCCESAFSAMLNLNTLIGPFAVSHRLCINI